MRSVKNIVFAARSLLRWSACFLTGPIYFAASAFYYWLYCGDAGVLDMVIIAELIVAAVGYWVMQLACVAEHNSWLDANPLRVARLTHWLGWRAAVVIAAASAIVMINGAILCRMAGAIHDDFWGSIGWLAVCWVSGLLLGTFVLRWLSTCCSRVRPA